IVEKAHFHNKKVFLSTQFLKNMEEKPVPTIAEIIDMYNTFKMGIYGIQLSEETSIGKYPKGCLDVVKKVMQEIDSEIK
ncbi:pyruvate kinase, partial [Chloroflexota bacterium]